MPSKLCLIAYYFWRGRGLAAESNSLFKRTATLLLCGLCAVHWRNVRGVALRELFKEKDFGDGVHFAYEFKANGSFTGTEMTKSVAGSWRVRRNELCWKWRRPRGPEECYDVQQDGAHVRLLINGSEAWYGTLEARR